MIRFLLKLSLSAEALAFAAHGQASNPTRPVAYPGNAELRAVADFIAGLH